MILDFSRSNVLSGAIRFVRVALYDSSELADEESLTPHLRSGLLNPVFQALSLVFCLTA